MPVNSDRDLDERGAAVIPKSVQAIPLRRASWRRDHAYQQARDNDDARNHWMRSRQHFGSKYPRPRAGRFRLRRITPQKKKERKEEKQKRMRRSFQTIGPNSAILRWESFFFFFVFDATNGQKRFSVGTGSVLPTRASTPARNVPRKSYNRTAPLNSAEARASTRPGSSAGKPGCFCGAEY